MNDRIHILEGLNIALININIIIKIIKSSKNAIDAKKIIIQKKWLSEDTKNSNTSTENMEYANIPFNKNNNKNTYYLTDSQAQAILDLRLNKLTNLEQKKDFYRT